MNEQLDLFASLYEKPKLPNHIRLIEFFAGIGAQSKALEVLGADFEHWRTAEWSIHSIVAYNAIHMDDWKDYSEGMSYEEVLKAISGVSADYNKPMTEAELKRKGESWARRIYSSMQAIHDFKPNVMDVHASDLDIRERESNTYVLTYSFPCVVGDELVLTLENGYIPFIEVNPGMHVISHDGEWHEVTKFFDNGVKETMFVEGQGFASIHCTPNHKFLTRTMKRIGHKAKRTFLESEWVEAKDLTTKQYLGVPVIKEEIPFHTESLAFWRLIGHYVGDGWTNGKAFLIACNERKLESVSNILNEMGIEFTICKNSEHCKNIRVKNAEIHKFICDYIGTGSKAKRIPYEILALPKAQLQAFFDGYVAADGCEIGKKTQITATNKNLAYSFSLIVNKLYHRVCCVYEVKTPDKHIIQGRVVNQSNWYQLRFKKTNDIQDKAFYEDGYIWYPFKKSYKAEEERVYDIEVEGAHSFVLNQCLIHNCQDLSNAGLMKGMEKGSGTRSGLLWEVERILNECKDADCLPQVLVMENVPGVCGESNLGPWNDWLSALGKLGYTNYFKVLNAKDYGIPQNRKRCFMVSILGEYSFDFPSKFKLRYFLKDFIYRKVDKKYYLSDELVKSFQAYTERNKAKGNGFAFEPSVGGGQPNPSSQEQEIDHATTSSKKVEKMQISNQTAKTILATQQKDHARDNTYIEEDEDSEQNREDNTHVSEEE